ncbi:MAG: hypothetical protein F2945_03825, partial [Actinobacteria bacterium]|nr:hypothetical protein [Actinomycetota bacterium]
MSNGLQENFNYKVMRNHKGLFFALITAITVVLSPNVSQAVDFNDLNKLSPQPAGSKRMIFSDILNGPGIVTSIMGTGYGDQFVSCKGLREGACAKASEVFSHVIVPPCNDSSKDSDVCIKDLTFINSAGSSEKAKLLYELDTRKFVADPTAKTPAGGGISVWQGNPENNSAGANTFGVRIGITYRIDYSSNSYSPGISRTDGFKAEIIPVTFKSGSQYIAMGEFEKLSNNDCAWTELGKCAVRQEFGKANPISITFQMDNRISGWLSGRMMDTSVGSKKLSATTNLLTVTGSPIDEPTGYADLTAVELAQNPDASKEFGLSNWAARPQGDRLNWQWGPYYRDISVLAANMNQDQFKVFYKEFREKYV